mgnify:FL=1
MPMKKLILLLTLITPFIFIWFLQRGGSDPTMDYSSLQGSGMSPQDYDALVKQRQTQYTDDDVRLVK